MNASSSPPPASVAAETDRLMRAFRQGAASDPAAALARLLAELERADPAQAEPLALECAGWLAERNRAEAAITVLQPALRRAPASTRLPHALALALDFAGRPADAERQLRAVLDAHPAEADVAASLARLIQRQGRYDAAAAVIETFCAHAPADPGTVLSAARFADQQCDRADVALRIVTRALPAIDAAPLQFEAGRLAMKLGRFEQARAHLLRTLEQEPPLADLRGPALQALAMSRRCESAQDADLSLCDACLADPAIDTETRVYASFAKGKLREDLGDLAGAAQCYRAGNDLVRAHSSWSEANWRGFVASRIARHAEPPAAPDPAAPLFCPVFVVGMPRTGTTLLAELLAAEHPQVINRGEMGWIETLANELADERRRRDPRALRQAAATYTAHLIRDDAPARWYIDKQPFNFCHVDLIVAMFPGARIVHCRRDARDTALSIWSQYFAGNTSAFSCDFARIAATMEGEAALMRHWQTLWPERIHTVEYESLIADRDATLGALAAFLGIGKTPAAEEEPREETGAGKPAAAIGSSSLWQARQAVYANSVGRWRDWLPFVPELARFGAA